MSKSLKTPFALLMLLLLGARASSQSTNNPISKISIASPTAAALAKYGDIPVNYHTGIPEISLPIYTVIAGPLSLPISLSYHASGLKVQEPSSWVGAGWSLNAGGVITRSVMGAPDEKGTNYAATETHGHFSDYGYNNYLNNASGSQDWGAFAKGWKDGEPDLFFFNIGGASGKFYFRDDRTPVIIPEADFKIEPYYTGTGSIQSFIITASDGKKYYFGNTPGLTGTPPIEITKPVTAENGLSTANTISSWYLNKISTPDDQFSITFSYVPENYGYMTLSMFPIDGYTQEGGSGTFGSTHGYDLIKNVVQGVRLSQIIFPNGTIDFVGGSARTDLSDGAGILTDDVNQNAKPLASIQVKDGGTMIKQFNLTYGYFVDNSTPLPTAIQNFAPTLQTDKQRLRLDGLQEVAGDNSQTIPSYSFAYFNQFVPRRISFGIDHWGFINGSNSNASLIPAYIKYGNGTTTNYQGADRDSHWPEMLGGTLQKITYPTGGYSQFDFGPNTLYGTTTSTINAYLLNLIVHLYGQSALTNSSSFSTDGTAMNLALNNTSNYPTTCTIKDANNAVVYTTTIQEYSSAPTITLNLPLGTYQTTLTLPNYGNVTGGCTAVITQWQTVQSTQNIIVGGNRVTAVTTNDGVHTNNVVTSYDYAGDNGQTSGILYSRPAYVGIIRNDILQNVGEWTVNGYAPNMFGGCVTGPDASYFKSPASIRPMATTQGSHFGYSQVKVSQSGNGYSLYKYYGSTGVPPWQANSGDIVVRTINVSGCNSNAPSFPYAPLPFDYMRGELQYQGTYNEGGQKVKEVSYVPTYVENPEKTPCFIAHYGTWSSAGAAWTLGTYYELSTARKTQMQVTETVYGISGAALTTTNSTYYESPFHHEVTRSSSLNSKGETVEAKNKYALDFRLSTCDGLVSGYPQYTTDCNTCQTNYNNQRLACNGNSQCLTTAYLNYQQCLATSRANYVTYRRNNFTDPVNNFKTYHDNAKSNADAELKPILELQDRNQNPVIEASAWKGTKLASATYLKYDFVGSNVYPSKNQSLPLRDLATTFTTSTNTATTVNKDSRYVDESSALFANGTLTQLLDKSGVFTSYIWNTNNTLPLVKATGVDYATLSAAYTTVSSNIAQLRSQASLAGALVNTYTYNPLIGMTSETDANGKSIFYEYDGLGRLSIVRDKDGKVLKKYCYNYAGQPEACGMSTAAIWQATGQTRCKPCPANSSYTSNIQEHQEIDANPNSTGYNTSYRWIEDGPSAACTPQADWQLISASCETGSGGNTGNQIRNEQDMNPCSPTANQTRQVTVSNTTSCPLPSTCTTANCPGPDHKCINGSCETGSKVYVASTKINKFTWQCTYVYCFSDGTRSAQFTENNSSGCAVTGCYIR